MYILVSMLCGVRTTQHLCGLADGAGWQSARLCQASGSKAAFITSLGASRKRTERMFYGLVVPQIVGMSGLIIDNVPLNYS